MRPPLDEKLQRRQDRQTLEDKLTRMRLENGMSNLPAHTLVRERRQAAEDRQHREWQERWSGAARANQPRANPLSRFVTAQAPAVLNELTKLAKAADSGRRSRFEVSGQSDNEFVPRPKAERPGGYQDDARDESFIPPAYAGTVADSAGSMRGGTIASRQPGEEANADGEMRGRGPDYWPTGEPRPIGTNERFSTISVMWQIRAALRRPTDLW